MLDQIENVADSTDAILRYDLQNALCNCPKCTAKRNQTKPYNNAVEVENSVYTRF